MEGVGTPMEVGGENSPALPPPSQPPKRLCVKSLRKTEPVSDQEQPGPSSKARTSYCGKDLIVKVRDDMKEIKINELNCAWAANTPRMKEAIVKEGTGRPNTAIWTCKPMEFDPNPRKKIKPITIPPVESNPPMVYWVGTTINVPTSDSKGLTNLPYLGDDHGEEKKKSRKKESKLGGNFGETLLELYEHKLDPDGCDPTPLEVYDDLDLIDYIRVLMKICEISGENVLLENGSIKLTPANLRPLYKLVTTAEDKSFSLKKPSLALLKAVCNAFHDPVEEVEMEPKELYKRYMRLCTKRDPDFGIVKHTPPVNVDLPGIRQEYSKAVQMDSYKSLFCKICYVYSCPKHPALLTDEEISTIQTVAKLDRTEKPVSTGRKTKGSGRLRSGKEKDVECSFQNCWKKAAPQGTFIPIGADPQASWERLLLEWTPVERTMFNCQYDSIQDYCVVAALIGTKTCRQVMAYHRIREIVKPRDVTLMLESCHLGTSNPTTPTSEVPPETPGSSGYGSSPGQADAIQDKDLSFEFDKDNLEELSTFTPCMHANGKCDATCRCVIAKRKCEAACGCLKICKNRNKGCVCLQTCDTKRCPCYIQNRECDPDLCKGCGADNLDLKKVTCKNIVVQRRLGKKMYMAKSKVSGWGAFAGEPIKKDEFIQEYNGELISNNEAEKRGHIYDERHHTYLFTLDNNLVLDALHIGNSSKFINSSKRPNCQAVKTNVRGEIRLAIRAKRDIVKDEELFIDYHEVLNAKRGDSKPKSKKYATK